MTDIQAALGLSQLERLDEFVARRQKLAGRYDRLLADLPLTLPWQHPDVYSAWHLYVVRLQLEKIKQTRREVFDALREQSIGVNVHYIPVHLQPYYLSRELGTGSGEQEEGGEQVESGERGAGSREQGQRKKNGSACHAPCAMRSARYAPASSKFNLFNYSTFQHLSAFSFWLLAVGYWLLLLLYALSSTL